MDAQETRFYYSVINYCVNKIITLIADYDHSIAILIQGKPCVRQTSVEVLIQGKHGSEILFVEK